MALAARQREDGAGGGAADAGQRLDCLEGGGKLAAVARDQALRAGAQVAGAGVVPEAGPQMHHLVLGRLGQGLDVGKAGHEAFVVRNHDRDLGLLQHDLGHPHPIGGGVLLPGQVLAAVGIEPGEQRLAEGFRVAGSSTGSRLLGSCSRSDSPRSWLAEQVLQLGFEDILGLLGELPLRQRGQVGPHRGSAQCR